MGARKSPPEKGDDSAPPATPEPTEDEASWFARNMEAPFGSIRDEILASGALGSINIVRGAAANLESSTEPGTSTSTTTSKPSGKRSTSSKRHWKTPTNARQLAAQINSVATMLLNGEIDVELVRPYSTLIRGEVQTLSVQVTQARFSRTVPDLTLDLDVFDAGDEDVDRRQTPPSVTEADAV